MTVRVGPPSLARLGGNAASDRARGACPHRYVLAVFGRHEFTHDFRVSPDALWHALVASLSCLTQKATWYERDRRVEWVVSLTGWSWTQVMHACVEPTADGFARLRFSGKASYRAAIGDTRRRQQKFDTLVAAMDDALAHPLTMHVEDHGDDAVRWWNGQEWTVDPPPA